MWFILYKNGIEIKRHHLKVAVVNAKLRIKVVDSLIKDARGLINKGDVIYVETRHPEIKATVRPAAQYSNTTQYQKELLND